MGKRRKRLNRYFEMGEDELMGLPAFDGDGGVVFYDVGGGYLLGKEGLVRAVRHWREDWANSGKKLEPSGE